MRFTRSMKYFSSASKTPLRSRQNMAPTTLVTNLARVAGVAKLGKTNGRLTDLEKLRRPTSTLPSLEKTRGVFTRLLVGLCAQRKIDSKCFE